MRSIRLSLLSSINSQVANIMLPELMLSKQRRVHSNLKHSEFDVNDNIWTHGFSRASPHRHLETLQDYVLNLSGLEPMPLAML